MILLASLTPPRGQCSPPPAADPVVILSVPAGSPALGPDLLLLCQVQRATGGGPIPRRFVCLRSPFGAALTYLAPAFLSHRRVAIETLTSSVRLGAARALVVTTRADSVKMSHYMGSRLFMDADDAPYFPEPTCRAPRARNPSELHFLTQCVSLVSSPSFPVDVLPQWCILHPRSERNQRGAPFCFQPDR